MKPARALALLIFATSLPARVSLSRLDGNRFLPVATTNAARSGQFVFTNLPEGYYQLAGIRPGFAETRYGQRRYNGAGTPIFISRDGSQFAELRLRRFGAITGRINDENGVGLPGISVLALAATPPYQLLSTARSDDRGIYRITGLLPGPHIVRTDAARLEDAFQLLPTYHPLTTTLPRDARIVPVDLDTDSPDIDIQPAPGALFSITVTVSGCLGSARVTLASEAGRREAIAACGGGGAEFAGLAPGPIEILAEGAGDRQPLAAFQQIHAGSDRLVGLSLYALPELELRLAKPAGIGLADISVLARRRDPSGTGPARFLTGSRVALPPGTWQLAVLPPATHYLSEFTAGGFRPNRPGSDPNPDWFEIQIERYTSRAQITLSAHPARLSGRITLGGKPSLAQPVFLLPTNQPTRRLMNGVRVTQSDTAGNYLFEGLAPGSYLVLSSLDIAEITEETMTASQATPITIEEGRPVSADLVAREVSR